MYRLSAFLLLAGSLSFAQASPADPSVNASSIVLRDIPTSFDCPVDFRANRQSTTQILSANDAARTTPALGLHLTLDHLAAPAIESIEVTVYGVSPRGRVLPTSFQAPNTNTRDTVSKSFLLHRSASDNTLAKADVWMNKVGALRWVDLNEIRYSDGTLWRPSASAKCRAVPSDFVLIGQR